MSSNDEYEDTSTVDDEYSESESESNVDDIDDEFMPATFGVEYAVPPAHRSGSMINFPRSIKIDDKIQTEEQYLKRLEKRGWGSLQVGRTRRKRQRTSLEKGGLGELTKTIVALQSSSSEDDSDDDRRINLPILDWDRAEWGDQESLFQHLPAAEFSSLIGWAHHLKSDSDCPQNRLLDVPNTPLPPSLLNFITSEAVLTTNQPGSISWQTQHFLMSGVGLPTKQQNWQKYKRLDQHKSFWAYNSDDENYQWIKKNWKPTTSVEITVPVPSRKTLVTTEPIPLDISARVALGMVIEELLTDSLMPLARHHVARCRRKDNAIDDWTMPVEEAIIASENASPLPSSLPVEGQADPELVTKWCESRGLDAFFVQSNMHLYSKLLPCAPALPHPAISESSRRSRQRRLRLIKTESK